MRHCRKCGVELIEGENWHASHAKAYNYICIPCQKAYSRNWHKEHPDYNRRYNEEHREERAAYYRQYRKEHLDYYRQWRKEHPDYHRRYNEEHREERAAYYRQRAAYYRQRYKEHRDEYLAYYRQYYAEHRDEYLAYYRQWYKEHPDYHRQYRKANPDKNREQGRRRRARKLGATIEPVDEAVIYALYDNTCLYCGATDNLTLDHVVPLNGGGSHCQDNLVVACRSCNSSKSVKPLEDWLQTQSKALAWIL